MLKHPPLLIIILLSSFLSSAQSPTITYQLSPSPIDTESGDQPYIAFNTTANSNSKFARLYSYNTTSVARDATIYLQEFDQQLKLIYSKIAPNQDSIIAVPSKATRIFYLDGVLHVCYYRLAGPNQFFYFFKSSFENNNLTLSLVHTEEVQSTFFDDDSFFQKSVIGYDFSYDFTTSPDGQLLLLSVVGSRRTGEKSTIFIRTFKSKFEFVWEKQIDLPTTPNVFMLKNSTKQVAESFSQDYSFRPYAVNQVMNGLPQLMGLRLENNANAFVRIDEITESRKLFGIKSRHASVDRDWYGVYDFGSRVIKQFDASAYPSLIATLSNDSVTVSSFTPRVDETAIPLIKASVTGLSPLTPAKEEFIDKVKAVKRDSAGNTFVVTIHTQEKKADGFSILKLTPQGAISKMQFIPIKNFSELLWADIVGEKFTVLFSIMPNSQTLTGFNAMFTDFTSYLMQAEMDLQGVITTKEIQKVSGEGPNLVYLHSTRKSKQLLFGWYSHDIKKLHSYSMLTVSGQ